MKNSEKINMTVTANEEMRTVVHLDTVMKKYFFV